jgi:hypothetical protein
MFTVTNALFAQNDTADLSGTVMDQSGAVVVRAQVDLTNSETDLQRTVYTSERGSFSLPALPPGKYTLRAEHDGYQITQSQQFALSAGDERTVIIKLELARIHQVVIVSDDSEELVHAGGEITNLTTEQEITELPTVSREFGDQRTQAFALQNPGTTWSRGGWVAVDGGRNLDNTQTVDGMIVTAQMDGGGGTVVQSGMEGTSEVSVELADSPAEYPRASQYSTITKAGTNQYHGSLFYNYNGDVFNAADYFATRVPFRVYNDGGVSVGGPIQRDRTFFFADWEHSRESVDNVIAGSTPLAAWRSGDFSGLAQPVINPYTGQPFAGNRIPAGMISTVAQKVQSLYYPLPNYGAATLESSNYRALLKPGQSGLTVFDSYDLRLDRRLGANDLVYASFNFINTPYASWTGGSLPPFGLRHSFRLGRSGQLSWTHILSPNLVNEARIGATRQKNSIRTPYVGSQILSEVGIEGVATTGVPTVPIMSVAGITTANQVPYFVYPDNSFQETDNLTWTRGAHTMRYGFTVVRDQSASVDAGGSVYGQYNFSGSFTGFPYADFLLGLPQTDSLTIMTPKTYRFGNWWNGYAEDHWKLSPQLTLDYGLRWEAQGPYHEQHDMLSSFDPATGSIVIPDDAGSRINPLYPKNLPIETAAEAHYPDGTLLDFHKAYFYPRLGFAWRPITSSNLVVRGGYGVYGNSIYGSLNLAGGPFAGSESFTNHVTSGAATFSFPAPFAASGSLPTQNVTGVNPHLRVPYLQQWNLTVDKDFGNYALSAAYVGSKATSLIYSRNIDQPPPSTTPFSPGAYIYPLFNSVTWADNGGTENYNSLQVSARRNLSRGLFFKAGWTWAKDLTETQDQTSYTGPLIQNAYDHHAEYGNATNVSRHRLFLNAIWQIPPSFASHWNPVARQAAQGWNLTLSFAGATGSYFTPQFTGFDPSNTNNFTGRPDVIPGVSTTPAGGHRLTQWFNPGAFKIPGCPDSAPLCSNPVSPGRFGDARVNSLEAPDFVNVNAALFKDFSLWEAMHMQFRITAQNVLNHANFSPPANVAINSPTAGNITSTYSETDGSTARQLDIWVRMNF